MRRYRIFLLRVGPSAFRRERMVRPRAAGLYPRQEQNIGPCTLLRTFRFGRPEFVCEHWRSLPQR